MSRVIRQATARLTPVPGSVPAIRAATVQKLAEWCVNEGAVSVAELVVCELVTNAVRVSAPGGTSVRVRLSITHGRVMVEVWSRPDDTLPAIQNPDVESENGRGLAIVQALSGRWDAYLAESGGVVVCAEFPGRVVPVQRSHPDASELPTREPKPFPTLDADDSETAGKLRAINFSDDSAVIARVALLLRRKWPLGEKDPGESATVGTAPGPCYHRVSVWADGQSVSDEPSAIAYQRGLPDGVTEHDDTTAVDDRLRTSQAALTAALANVIEVEAGLAAIVGGRRLSARPVPTWFDEWPSAANDGPAPPGQSAF